MWVVYIYSFSAKGLFIWNGTHYEVWWQDFMHITDIHFLKSLSEHLTYSCLGLIILIILKFGMYLASQFNFLSMFLIITKSPILYCDNLRILTWAAEMLLDVANRGHIWNIRGEVIPGSVHLFIIPSSCERCSINLDLNFVPLSKYSILGNPNLSIMSESRWVATVIVFFCLL